MRLLGEVPRFAPFAFVLRIQTPKDPSLAKWRRFMKTVFLLIIATIVVTCIRAAAPQLVAVPVQLGLQKFADGDSIAIQQVLATSPRMDVGDTVVVRGTYALRSRDRANLGLSLTQTETRERTKVSPAANMTAERGIGQFELTYRIQHVGCLHVTFSSLPEKRSFGTLYFGTPEQLARVRGMRWNH